MNMLKSRIQNSQVTRGLWLEAGSPVMAEAAVYAGMRFLMIDNEHGPASVETTAHMARAIEAAGGHPMVRVSGNDIVHIKRMLEIGIQTLMVPMVHSADEARAAVDACRYPPFGQRGFAGDIRASRYARNPDYAKTANDDVFLIVQIESPEGVENAQAIAAVDGVDMIFIGPYDMSGGYGKPGETDCAEVEAAVLHIADIARTAGKPLGTVPRKGQSAAALLANGFDLVIFGSEVDSVMSFVESEVRSGASNWF